MAQLNAQDLVTALQLRAGESLRCIGHYTPEDWSIEYVREDVQAQHSTDEIEEVVEDLRWQAFKKEQAESQYDIGELECSIRVFDQGLVMNFPERDRAAGTVVTLDPEAARQLVGFVEDVQEWIE